MAKIYNLKTKPTKLKEDQAALLRQALLPFEDQIPKEAFNAVIGQIDKQTATNNKWTFIMLSPQQNNLVVQYLADNSKRPMVALKLWALCFEYIRIDTGEILLTRPEIAKKLNIFVNDVSSIMTELEKIGAIIRKKDGRNVRYFMNPKVATHLGGLEREKAQNIAPNLKILNGGLNNY